MNTNTILIASFLSSMLAACGGATGTVEGAPVPVQSQPDAGVGEPDSGTVVEPTEASTIDQPDADSGSMVEADANAPEANVEASAPDAGADACLPMPGACGSGYVPNTVQCDPSGDRDGVLLTCDDGQRMPPMCTQASFKANGLPAHGVWCCDLCGQ